MGRYLALSAWWLPVALLGFASTGAAQERPFWSFLERGRTVPRCIESSLAHQDADARLALLDEYFDRLQPSVDVASTVGELHALLRSECFLPAAETDRLPSLDSTLSAKRWWFDGGRHWLFSYLKLPEQGVLPNLRPHVVLAPDARQTLALENHRDHRLRPLLCPIADALCGVETSGWIQRAELAFETHGVIHAKDATWFPDDPDPPPTTPEAVSAHCAATLPSGDNGARYQAWRDCLELRRPMTSGLPLGRIKPPRTGWLIVSGRRGHYDFCDRTGAYDLETGAAFVHESCSALHLVTGGDVDRAATDAGRTDNVRTGRLPIDNLREAVWMMLLQEETKRIQVRAEWYPLPEGLAPETRARSREFDGPFSGVSMSTGQTTLTWRWLPSTGPALNGTVIWPRSYDGAEDHAAVLLDVAELALQPGCVPRRPPSESVLGRPDVRVNPRDAPPRAGFFRDAAAAYKQWARAPLCK